jgi:hemerythrin-like metal-binding protein
MTTSGIEFKQTGIPAIDEQHAQLVSYLERFLMWIDKGHGFAAAFDAVESLSSYTRTHFEFEEQHMRDHRYPKLAGHIELHQAIIRALDGLKADLESAKDVEDDLAGMLRVWIVKHIDIEDMEYAVFLGTAPPADRA